MAAIGMQVKTIVVAPPHRPDGIRLFQDCRLHAHLFEGGRARHGCSTLDIDELR